MKKIAIFWENRFNNNKIFDITIDPNLSPYVALKTILKDNIISYNLLKNHKDKADYTILCFLTLSLFSIKDYIKLFIQYPRNKKYFFIFEPRVVSLLSYNRLFHLGFEKIYTMDDDLVDNKKYFKFTCPMSLHGWKDRPAVPFVDKKLLTLINGNKKSFVGHELYSARRSFIRYAESNNIEFDLYGTNWTKPITLLQRIFGFKPYSSYRGTIGTHDKIEVLSHYKFNVCFENTDNANGYITEKIFDSFKAKVVPIYWGAPNIEHYIPKNCFIDYRNFNGDYAKLIHFLDNMSASQYAAYILNIENFMMTKEAKERFDLDWAKKIIKTL